MIVLYLAHDLDDAGVRRRANMLRTGGAEVRIAGFVRTRQARGEGIRLGRTADGRMVHRALAVLRAGATVRARTRPLGLPDVILARNLEMLALARLVAMRQVPPPKIFYETIDIHRLLVGGGYIARAMRLIERRLCNSIDLLLTSSPGFLAAHFDRYNVTEAPIHLIENKVLELDAAPFEVGLRRTRRPPGAPITIGWFGILRCRASLDCLDAVTRAHPGRYRVMLRGKPDLLAVPHFHAVAGANPDLVFGGPYCSPEDLPELYGSCDLAWVIDRMDAGANSDWLLPNRLYEGCYFGAVPLALEGTETARFLASHDIGTTLANLLPETVAAELDLLDHEKIAALREAVKAIPRNVWVFDKPDCLALVALFRDPKREADPLVLSQVQTVS